MKKLIYSPQSEKYGFILFAAKFGDRWGKIPDEEHLFIYYSDFEYIIDSVKNIYPLLDPETNELVESFDVCGMNCINTKAWNRIIEDLSLISYNDEKLERFISDFCLWISTRQETNDEIMVQGTL